MFQQQCYNHQQCNPHLQQSCSRHSRSHCGTSSSTHPHQAQVLCSKLCHLRIYKTDAVALSNRKLNILYHTQPIIIGHDQLRTSFMVCVFRSDITVQGYSLWTQVKKILCIQSFPSNHSYSIRDNINIMVELTAIPRARSISFTAFNLIP